MKFSEVRKMQNLMEKLTKEKNLEELRQLAEQNGLNLDNAYQEMEMDDFYVDTHEDPGSNPYGVQLHSHNYYEILYICSGNIQYLIRTERYRIQKGDIVIVPPGISHQPILSENSTGVYKRYVLWLSPAFISGLCPLFPNMDFLQPQILRTTGTVWATIGNKFYAGIMESERQNPGWQAALYGNSLELVTMLYRIILDKNALHLKSEMPELLDKILSYIEDCLSEEISLDSTARKFFVSRSTINNLFRKELGISFYRYVTQRRLVASKNYVLEGLPLEEISELVGFCDYSSFYRAFKKEYGISPRQFREQQGQT